MVKKSLVELAQEGMSYARAATFVPQRNGRRVHASTVMRWARDGVIGPDGKRIRLGVHRIGGRQLVTLAALEEFFLQLNADGSADDPESDDGDDMARRGREAGKALEALGA